jgi:hypothetical protein
VGRKPAVGKVEPYQRAQAGRLRSERRRKRTQENEIYQHGNENPDREPTEGRDPLQENEILRQPKISVGKTGSNRLQIKAHSKKGMNTKNENHKFSA